MPTFEFRLEAQDDSGHYRQGAGFFGSKEEAREYLEMKEQANVMYRLDSTELADAKNDPGTSANRSKLALHAQEKPYKLVRLEERKEG